MLWVVTVITGSMFLIEFGAGLFSGSLALQADAIDFLDDALAYGLSLAVVGANARLQAAAAFVKGLCLCLMALWVFGSSAYHMFASSVPRADVMAITGLLALLANITCSALLARSGKGNAIAPTEALSLRHDIVGNVAVLTTAAAVWAFQTPWPDLLVAIVAAGMLLNSAGRALKQSATLFHDKSR